MNIVLKMQRVFVYGTLKRGQPNHHLISAGIESGDCRVEGVGVTEAKYPLIVTTRYNVPYLLDAHNARNAMNVEGEVYSVNDRMMEILDDLEAHPSFYTRTQIPIIFQEKSEKMWCYLMQNFRQDVLQLPMNSRYDVKAHGTYVGRANRPPGKEEAMAYRAEIKENA